MNIIWIGFHYEGLPAFRAVLENGVRIDAFITLVAEQAEKRSGSASYDDICSAFGVPVYRVRNINDPEAVDLLRSLKPDVAFVIGWTQIVRKAALSSARVGMIGAHASLLPHNRGRAPVNWALIRGEKETGNTLFWLSEGTDEGDVLYQTAFPITPYDTCDTLYRKVADSNREMILQAVQALASGDVPRRPQARNEEKTLPGRKPEDGLIDWTSTAEHVYNFIRALTRPYPGAFTFLDGERYLVWSAALFPLSNVIGTPGEVLGPVLSPEICACGQFVACGNGGIVLLELEDMRGNRFRGQELSNMQWKGKVFGNE